MPRHAESDKNTKMKSTDEYVIPAPELRPEISLRLGAVAKAMADSGMDAMLIASNANLYYAAGMMFRGYVYLTREGRAVYFVIRPQEVRQEENVVVIRKPEMIPDVLGQLGIAPADSIGLELDVQSYSDIERLKKVFAGVAVMNASPLLRGCRQVKTPYEISLMKEDGQHHVAVYRKIQRLYRREMTDVEFQIAIEHELRSEGSLGFLRVSGQLMEINLGSVDRKSVV